ncbi:SPRY domain-containing protein 3-like [Gigantopelta aegis]|uniref:SPRY domain-containing protein 3-like n=1 Tax=Gigantopelta aegis TaxID=1735272 RepID=UPI001B88C835|nr:SPRY domain-containing protein 3-like [Gigantopelta aegis]XP_041365188.1 SPRY domain-containing protein 3-like [Gigantopelta aegis]XP_041365189.1 SPRY domain-containing protein 3-like [Gigantopelta aegis]
MEAFLRNQILNVCRVRHNQRFREVNLRALPKHPRFERLNVDGDIISFIPNDANKVGLYMSAVPITAQDNYFEVEIIDTGMLGCIGIGLVPFRYSLEAQPGWNAGSVGYHADEGKLFKACGFGKIFGPKCHAGDRLGCGIKPSGAEAELGGAAHTATVFFTRNGREIGSVNVSVPPGGLYPAVGMHSEGEEVRLILDAEWTSEELTQMAVDSEDDWNRLHDVKVNGSLLEYAGRGKSIHDVGLAQAKIALDTTCHYFELEIIDPGENCYIAIGLARRNYPKQRHPGWNKGSIAYHADDGKIFVGSGVGEKFGPKCHTGDIMGCGILFPSDYDSEADSDLSPDEPEDIFQEDAWESSDEEDEEPWPREEEKGTKVQIFFTRNGKILGKRSICIPKGGLYPTIGMMSSYEKVRVDLRPLTG